MTTHIYAVNNVYGNCASWVLKSFFGESATAVRVPSTWSLTTRVQEDCLDYTDGDTIIIVGIEVSATLAHLLLHVVATKNIRVHLIENRRTVIEEHNARNMCIYRTADAARQYMDHNFSLPELAHQFTKDHASTHVWAQSYHAEAIVKMMTDRVTWTFAIPETKKLFGAIKFFKLTTDWEMWDKLATDKATWDEWMEVGAIVAEMDTRRAKSAALRHDAVHVTELSPELTAQTGTSKKILQVAFINETENSSDTADAILTANSMVDVVVAYSLNLVVAKFEIRSRKSSDIDVSAIAKLQNGGGQTNAAGWTTPTGRAFVTMNQFMNSGPVTLRQFNRV